MAKKTSLLRAIFIGFRASSIFLMLVAFPTLFLDAIAKVKFLPKMWSLLWTLYLWPGTLLDDGGLFDRALTLSSPDPRIALIPTLLVNLILWGVLFSAVTLFTLRLRNET